MISGLASDRAFQYVIANLDASAPFKALVPGGYWRTSAPPGTGVFVSMSLVSAPDVTVVDSIRIAVEPLLKVCVVGEPKDWTATLQPAADLMDSLLHNTSGSAGGMTIAKCVRESEVSYETNEQGQVWTFAGGLYRFYVY